MIRKLLYRFHKWVGDYNLVEESNTTASRGGLISLSDRDSVEPSIRFSVTTARGGVIVASRTYDRQKDRNNEIIHVIHDDEDVAQRVGEIVALELMKA